MKEKSSKANRIRDIISTIFIIIILVVGYKVYKKNNFNKFTKAEHNMGYAIFERDDKVKKTDYDSYKITNTDYNDAMFYETVNVVPNTSYKVSCKIKTENVKTKNENTDSGAHIAILDTVEKSDNVVGTHDWTDVNFYFNSKNRTEVKLGFRLGGYEDDCIGTAWFTDFKMESGIADKSNTWNFLCILFDKIDVNIEKNGNTQNVQLSLSRFRQKRYRNMYGLISNKYAGNE